jgi:8-oxo-dGTP pyrophosphatase MutT (NUDIX family)
VSSKAHIESASFIGKQKGQKEAKRIKKALFVPFVLFCLFCFHLAILCALFVFSTSIAIKPMTDFELLCQQLSGRLAPLAELQIEPDRIPQAAVTIILREEERAAQALIIKRAERPGDHWSGHLALPGGRVDPIKDADLLTTAAREAYEEVGIDLLNGGSFIGRLPVITPNHHLLPRIEIAPFVAIAPAIFSIQLNHEVDNVFWVPVSQLKRTGLSGEFRMKFGDVIKKWPAYPSEGGPIWGITERIITSFLSSLPC